MKKIFYLTFLIIGVLMNSCDRNEKDGKWRDNINLSQKSANFNSNSNSITITTKTKNWWLNVIALNGANIDLNGVNILAQNFVITNPEFQIERKEGNKIIINVPQNASNNDRIINIGLQNGDYFDGIKIIQSK